MQSIEIYRTGATRTDAKIFNDPSKNIWLLELIDNVIALTDGEFHVQIRYAGNDFYEWELLFKILREFIKYCNYLVLQGEIEITKLFPVFTSWRHKYEIYKTSEVLKTILWIYFFYFFFFFGKQKESLKCVCVSNILSVCVCV